MPKSKLRGGAKAHRKRVQKRNNKIMSERDVMQKKWQEEMMKRIEEMNEQQENNEDNPEVMNNENPDIEVPLDIRL